MKITCKAHSFAAAMRETHGKAHSLTDDRQPNVSWLCYIQQTRSSSYHWFLKPAVKGRAKEATAFRKSPHHGDCLGITQPSMCSFINLIFNITHIIFHKYHLARSHTLVVAEISHLFIKFCFQKGGHPFVFRQSLC